jgi:hypothetical protein
VKTLNHIKTLTQLLEVAKEDVNKVMMSSDYVLDVDKWHAPQKKGPCLVCIAGAVMANTLEIPSNRSIIPRDMSRRRDTLLLVLLNAIRVCDADSIARILPQAKLEWDEEDCVELSNFLCDKLSDNQRYLLFKGNMLVWGEVIDWVKRYESAVKCA